MSIFSQIPVKKRKSTRFNLTHEVKTTIGIGELVPYMCREVLPGDVWNVSSDFLCRFAPMLAPIMHNVNIRTECFFVPTRLLWKEWPDFITGGKDGTLQPIKPYFVPSSISGSEDPRDILLRKSSLWDYMGMPIIDPQRDLNPMPSNLRIDLLPFLAYQMIHQEYYRDQNLTTAPFDFPLSGGDRTNSDQLYDILALRNRCWEKDYFTGALPFLQRGPEAVLPLGGDANVVFEPPLSTKANLVDMYGVPLDPNPGLTNPEYLVNDKATMVTTDSVSSGGIPTFYDPQGTMKADLSTATAVTINDLRKTNAIQRFLENQARGGSRLTETILSQFGVLSSDTRMQRPEYLGGGSSPCVISEVLQTSETAETPQANMAGHGVGGGVNHGCLRRFEEHGFIVCLMSIRPRASYMPGVEPMYTRFDKFDYAWPELANLGEQPVYNRELFCDPDNTNVGDSIFGYVPRYADYKYILSKTTGEFRDTMDFWHLTRKFSNQPVLSPEFVEIRQSDATRIFASGNESINQQIYVQILNKVSCVRRLPKYGIPMLS